MAQPYSLAFKEVLHNIQQRLEELDTHMLQFMEVIDIYQIDKKTASETLILTDNIIELSSHISKTFEKLRSKHRVRALNRYDKK